MAEYIERQVAIDALDKKYRYGGDIDRCGLATALDEIEAIPAADVVPVVRCKDCKYLGITTLGSYWCRNVNGCAKPTSDSFCSYGEGKE